METEQNTRDSFVTILLKESARSKAKIIATMVNGKAVKCMEQGKVNGETIRTK